MSSTSKTSLSAPKQSFGLYKTVISKLNLAKEKLLPVINRILKTASVNSSRLPYQSVKSYYLTMEQYKQAVWAADVLKEVAEILKFNKIKEPKCIKLQSVDFDVAKVKVNKLGKVYVDTPILVQLIDLHNMLGDAIKYIKNIPAEMYKIPKKSPTSKTSSENSCISMSIKQKAQVERITKEILTSLTMPLKTNFLVMAANSIHKTQIPNVLDEKSASEINLPPPTIVQVRHCKSLGSIFSTKQSKVDAVGARKIIIRCLADLERVKEYFEECPCGSKTPSATSCNKPPCEEEPCLCPEEAEEAGAPLHFVWKDDGENGSKVVICIKGKTEDEGDIHVVIRPCPECSPCPNKKSNQRFDISIENVNKPRRSKISFKVSSDKLLCGDQSRNDAINVVFDPDEPSKSVVEGPQIRLRETINLNLQNDEGQDLVISLCVKPKCPPKPACSSLDLEDLFSDCCCSKKPRIHVVERLTPLSRTKVCSSMEFDVGLVVSKLNTLGVQHPDRCIRKRLNDFGVNNILLASRPVKCGRKAILNEPQKKTLPYSASLRSLPLDNGDMAVIHQSINMCLHRSKHSRIFPDGRDEIDCKRVRFKVYFLHVLYRRNLSDLRKRLINERLEYYIYLEDDTRRCEGATYEVRYFDVDNCDQPTKNDTQTNSNTVAKTSTIATLYKSIDFSKRKKLQISIEKSKIPIYTKIHRRGIEQTTIPDTKCSLTTIYQDLSNNRIEEKAIEESNISNCSSTNSVYEETSCDLANIIYKSSSNNLVINTTKSIDSRGDVSDNLRLIVNAVERSEGDSGLFRKIYQLENENCAKETEGKSMIVIKPVSQSQNSFDLNNSLFKTDKKPRKSKKKTKKIEFYKTSSLSQLLVGKTLPRKITFLNFQDFFKNTLQSPQSDDHADLNLALSSTRFKRDPNLGRTLSKVIVNNFSNFLYESLIRDMSTETKLEILSKIDEFLGKYCKLQAKTIKSQGRRIKSRFCS
ncbi:unnamed protein product [Phyllotreta striolata]|uniref:Uncharacterized protein n=1 Tax=Phyllotreta striolata TaxID=444603 RepID=A0A9N9TZW2_PHYSR|nr:unnamed protein product [Phyllotreta striolata]